MRKNTTRDAFERNVAIATKIAKWPHLTKPRRKAFVTRVLLHDNPNKRPQALAVDVSHVNTIARMLHHLPNARRYAEFMMALDDILDTPPKDRFRYEQTVLRFLSGSPNGTAIRAWTATQV